MRIKTYIFLLISVCLCFFIHLSIGESNATSISEVEVQLNWENYTIGGNANFDWSGTPTVGYAYAGRNGVDNPYVQDGPYWNWNYHTYALNEINSAIYGLGEAQIDFVKAEGYAMANGVDTLSSYGQASIHRGFNFKVTSGNSITFSVPYTITQFFQRDNVAENYSGYYHLDLLLTKNYDYDNMLDYHLIETNDGNPLSGILEISFDDLNIYGTDNTIYTIEAHLVASATANSPPITAPVPEPATMLLIGSGLIGLAGYGRKKFFKK